MTERYEITDRGELIAITEPVGTTTEICGTDPGGGTYLDDVVIGAIRQQARDIEQLRTDMAAAVAITAARDETIAELELRLRISRMSNKELRESAEQAEARLAAIEAAPTVAVVSECAAGLYVHQKLFGAQLAEPGAELIYRPAKDQP